MSGLLSDPWGDFFAELADNENPSLYEDVDPALLADDGTSLRRTATSRSNAMPGGEPGAVPGAPPEMSISAGGQSAEVPALRPEAAKELDAIIRPDFTARDKARARYEEARDRPPVWTIFRKAGNAYNSHLDRLREDVDLADRIARQDAADANAEAMARRPQPRGGPVRAGDGRLLQPMVARDGSVSFEEFPSFVPEQRKQPQGENTPKPTLRPKVSRLLFGADGQPYGLSEDENGEPVLRRVRVEGGGTFPGPAKGGAGRPQKPPPGGARGAEVADLDDKARERIAKELLKTLQEYGPKEAKEYAQSLGVEQGPDGQLHKSTWLAQQRAAGAPLATKDSFDEIPDGVTYQDSKDGRIYRKVNGRPVPVSSRPSLARSH